MSFRLVPNSVTLNGVISPNSVAFGADYLKVVEDTPILYGDIGRGSPPARALK